MTEPFGESGDVFEVVDERSSGETNFGADIGDGDGGYGIETFRFDIFDEVSFVEDDTVKMVMKDGRVMSRFEVSDESVI